MDNARGRVGGARAAAATAAAARAMRIGRAVGLGGAMVVAVLAARMLASAPRRGDEATVTPTATPCAAALVYLPFLLKPGGAPYVAGTPVPRLIGGACPRAGSPTAEVTASSTASTTATTGASATAGAIASPTATAGVGTPSPTATGGTASVTATPSGSPAASATPRPSPSPTATRPANLLGVQAFEADFTALSRGLADQAGAGWLRTRALWAGIEPTDSSPRRREWGMSDSMISLAAARGLRPVVVVYTAPEWAAGRRCGPVDKVPLARYQEFIQALVERYDGDGAADAPGSPVVRYWEIGNEPDLAESVRGAEDYGSCFGDEPAVYAAHLRAAWLGARAADPQARVIFGPVAYDRFHNGPAGFGPAGPFNYGFVRETLEALYDAHGQEAGWPFFDLMAFHNYNDFRNNWDGADGEQPEIIGKAAHLRAQQLVLPGKFDLSAMPLFVSEVGLPSGPSDSWTERSEANQAAYVGQVTARAAAAGVQGAVWYTLTDLLPDPARPNCADPYFWLTHGLLRSRQVALAAQACPSSPLPGYAAAADFEPKPAYQALAVANRKINGAAFERRLDLALTDNADIEAYRYRRDDGAALIIAFTDHGERLGRRDWPDRRADLQVGPALLPGWTGRLRVTDHLGLDRVLEGATVTVTLDHRPLYLEVAP